MRASGLSTAAVSLVGFQTEAEAVKAWGCRKAWSGREKYWVRAAAGEAVDSSFGEAEDSSFGEAGAGGGRCGGG